MVDLLVVFHAAEHLGRDGVVSPHEVPVTLVTAFTPVIPCTALTDDCELEGFGDCFDHMVLALCID